jgi:alkanesulfonate monooxygenase SsuD/methylene tetrahydromethanopterin reductase-like flavin-dependent oxidoreductase (luciferase family)
MAAMNVTRRTAGESVDQLGEAIDVIREIWASDKKNQLRYDGSVVTGGVRSAAADPRTAAAS